MMDKLSQHAQDCQSINNMYRWKTDRLAIVNAAKDLRARILQAAEYDTWLADKLDDDDHYIGGLDNALEYLIKNLP